MDESAVTRVSVRACNATTILCFYPSEIKIKRKIYKPEAYIESVPISSRVDLVSGGARTRTQNRKNDIKVSNKNVFRLNE